MVQKVIADLVTRWRAEGADKAAAALQKAAAATGQADAAVEKYAAAARKSAEPAIDALATAQETFSRKTLVTARSIEAMQRKLDPVYRAMADRAADQKKLTLAVATGVATQERMNQVLALHDRRILKATASSRKMTGALNDNTTSAKLTAGQMQGLGYQINDIATMVAVGASPFQIIASQGGQILQVFQEGPGGVTGTMAALANEIKNLALRIGLVRLGFGAAAVAAIYFAMRSDSSVKSASEALEDYNDLLKDLDSGYRRAAAAAKEYAEKARFEGPNVALASILGTTTEIRASLQREIETLTAKTQSFITKWEDISPAVLKTQQDIRDLGNDLAAGDITAAQFRQKIAEIRIDPATPASVVKIADKLLDASVNARDLSNALDAVGKAAENANEKVGRLFIPSIGDEMQRFGGPLEYLRRMNPDAYRRLKGDLQDQADELRSASEKDPRKSAVTTDTIRSLYGPLRAQLRILSAESAAIGASDAARRRMLVSIEAENALRRQGIDLGSEFARGYQRDALAMSDFQAEVEKHVKVWEDIKDVGGNAIDDLVGSFTSAGDSIEDTLENIAQDFVRTFEQLAIANPLKNAIFKTDLPTISDLFSHPKAPPLSMPGLGGLGATPATAMWVRSADGGLGSLFGVNDNFLKGYRPGDVTRSPLPPISAAAKAIQSIESSGNYSALGPVLASGDRAYGAYQVMGANIPSWTKRALGYSLSPTEFLGSRSAQDAVFSKVFGGYVAKYGNMSDAASAWFTGGPLSSGAGKSDIFGTTGSVYVDRFNDALKDVTQTTAQVTNGFSALGHNVMPSLAGATHDATQGLGNLGSGLSKFGTSLSNWYPPAPGGGGGWMPGNIFGALGNFFRFGGSSQAFMATFTPGMYAKGTEFAPGGLAIVGEEGPELVKLPHGAKVVPHPRFRAFAESASLAGSAPPAMRSGGLKVVVNNNGEPVDATATESTDANGNRQVEIMLEKKIDDRVLRPSSPTNRRLRGTYGLSQQVVRR